VTRPDHRDHKAGNHNHALRLSTAPVIVSMDADFLPFPHVIYRTIGFFRSVILLAAMWWLGRRQFIPFLAGLPALHGV
jgi:cellulose synthase/poly-beta-1,6-N-acetylglucosamine synthase-like glycosyltransferase